jgi:hypothetical protein
MTAAEFWPSTAASARPRSAADIAQARLLDDLLQDEIAELRELAERVHGAERLRVNARIVEAQRLLDALRDRFPAT